MQQLPVIADRFEVDRLAGSGGAARVYRTRDRHTGEWAAVKILGPAEPRDVERFEREARLLAELRHPGIVRYVAHGLSPDGEHYIAMEWLEGVSLAERLRRGPLSCDEGVEVARRAAAALAAAHDKGVIHRDVKPSNLFLVGGRIDRLKVLDFGIARSHDARLTRTGAMLGTIGYLSPEQARGERAVDPSADVFSLGCVLFECLAGRPPFTGQSAAAQLAGLLLDDPPRLRSLRPDLPDPLDRLVERMLSKDPALRPPDGAAVARALVGLRCAAAAVRELGAAQPAGLTEAELRLVAVLLVAGSGAPAATGVRGVLAATAAAHGGFLERLPAGGTLVVFGAGSTPGDPAVRAARCALAIRDVAPGTSLALTTGWAGPSSLGPIVDRAAHLLAGEGAVPADVRMDEATARLLEGRFEVRRREGLPSLAEREPAPAARTLLGRPSPFVGREPELAALEALFAQCVSEPVARAVLLTAPPGAGKSRLAQEFVDRLRRRGAPLQIWTGRGDPLTLGSPFAMVASALRREAALREGEPLRLRQERLRARLSRHLAGSECLRATVFLGELLGLPFPDDASPELPAARRDRRVMADQVARAWHELLAAECAAEPVLLLLEDLQWGDLPSVQLVDSVLRDMGDGALLVLALARPEVENLFPGLWAERGVHHVRLGELTRRSAERLVREVLGKAADESLARRLVARSGGNAFYLEELIRATAEGRGESLPGTVLAMAQARLDGLDAEARRILRAASVFGQAFSTRGVRELLGPGQPGEQAGEWLAVLADHEILGRGDPGAHAEGQHAFRHALLREAAYASLTDEDRALGHRLAAGFLEGTGETDAVLLAEHWERGGERVRAVACYRRAAEQALHADDLDAALGRVERAEALGASGHDLGALRLVEAEARAWKGESLGRVERLAAEAMQRLARGGPEWYAAAGQLADAAGKTGDVERLVALAAELAGTAGAGPDAGPEVLALARTSAQLVLAGKAELAEALLRRLDECERTSPPGDPARVAWIAHARSVRALFQGDLGSYVQLKEAAVRGFERAGDRRDACAQRAKLGYALRELGACEEAERALRRAIEEADRLRIHQVATQAKHNLGLTLAHLGRLDEARAVEAEAIAAFRVQGDRRLEAASHVYLAMILVRLGDHESAAREATEGAALVAAGTPAQAHALTVLAHVRLAQGRPREALSSASEAMSLLGRLGGMDEGETLLRLVHVEALEAAGQAEAAREALRQARQRLLDRVARIQDPRFRQTFLGGLPENARTLEKAAALP